MITAAQLKENLSRVTDKLRAVKKPKPRLSATELQTLANLQYVLKHNLRDVTFKVGTGCRFNTDTIYPVLNKIIMEERLAYNANNQNYTAAPYCSL